MAERSRPWSGTALGDAGPYSDDQWTDVWKTLLAHVVASQGVFQDQLNVFALAGLAASPVTIDTGRALVNGIWYESDASVSVAIPTPAVNPRVDRIVLRADWALQTVRITRIAGAEGAAPTPPALVQVDGVTWDLPLWQVRITVAPVLTIERDERDFIGQYEPVGLSDTKVYLEWEFFGAGVQASGDDIGPFTILLAGGFTIGVVVEAGFGGGAIEFLADGAGVGGISVVDSVGHKPDQINARLRARTRQENTDASLDRILGFSSGNSLTPADGVFFRADGVGNWFAVCRAGGVETAVDTGQALDNTWRIFEIRQVDTSVVTFLIDGVVVATIDTNIPSDVAQSLRAGIFDDGVGTPPATRYMALDYTVLRGDR